MGAALLAITLLLAVLGAALVAMLFVPADYVISARVGTGAHIRVSCLFGLVRLGHRRARRDHPETGKPGGPRRARKAEREGRQGRSRPARGARIVGGLLAIDGLVPRVRRLGHELVRSLGWRRGRLLVRAGTGDPADTGQLCGVVGSLLVCVPARPELRVKFEPEFDRAVFRARAVGGGRLVPARLVGALGRFALSSPGRRAIKVLVWDSRR